MPESPSPHRETVAAGTLRALPLLCPLCWRCTLFFLSSRRGLIRAAAAIERDEAQGSLAGSLAKGAASSSVERAGGRTKDKRENRGWAGPPRYLPLAPAGLLPIPLRGSGPRRLGWEDGGNRNGPQWSSVHGPRDGALRTRPGPAPPGAPSRGRCGPPERLQRLPGRGPPAQPALPQAPSSRACE